MQILLKEYIAKMKTIQYNILEFLDQNENIEENYQNLINLLNNPIILENPCEIKSIIYLLANIANNHHREPGFFSKFEEIILFLTNKIIKFFSNYEIFSFFKYNKPILLFLIEYNILILNDEIFNFILSNDKFEKMQYAQFFSPEIKKEENNISDEFDDKRKNGENDDYLMQIIRDDLINEFIKYIDQNKIQINSITKSSIFETNLFLLMNEDTTLIEYAAFFGSIQIFQYLYSNKVELKPRIWLYAIHSNNIELIYFLRKNYTENVSFEECYKEAIKCHHNEIAYYIQTKFLRKEGNNFSYIYNDDINSCIFHYCNYFYLQEKLNTLCLFHFACEYDHFMIVKLLLKEERIDLNAKYKNETPLNAALKNNNIEIIKYLKMFLNANANEKIYIDVPFKEKDLAKSMGALFDWDSRMWYYKNPKDSYKFEKWKPKTSRRLEDLSDEQQELIRLAKEGKNLLVDACIGSGKTTTIQVLCNELPEKKILYLTYNRLLKIDAKSKIHSKNAFVTNYHGYAYYCLHMNHIEEGASSDLIQTFQANKNKIIMPSFNLLLIDEYQDIEQETAEMLEFIKMKNPNIQIIAVGDMHQKIYDKTTLNVRDFIQQFLNDYKILYFTKCFRLNKVHAKRLGMIWNKEIIGVNDECEVKEMPLSEIVPFLASKNNSDILCLGARTGTMSTVLNVLENNHPEKFNKKNVYASIMDEDRSQRKFNDNEVAIFTTYDSSKGLERKICVIFDFTKEYWERRLKMNDSKYNILRNIFCVAASRGKSQIIFVIDPKDHLLKDERLATPFSNEQADTLFCMSNMFSFKYKEDIEECYRLLDIEVDKTAEIKEIPIKRADGLIDLSPCIGILQEASFFENYKIDSDIRMSIEYTYHNRTNLEFNDQASLEEKVLYLVALETHQERYSKQVKIPFVNNNDLRIIKNRMKEVFSPSEKVQVYCEFHFIDNGIRKCCVGNCDVLKDDAVWELKFISELAHEHYLQCACYMVALGIPKGVIWNIRTNERAFITIPDRKVFMDAVIKTITKGKAFNCKFLINDIQSTTDCIVNSNCLPPNYSV